MRTRLLFTLLAVLLLSCTWFAGFQRSQQLHTRVFQSGFQAGIHTGCTVFLLTQLAVEPYVVSEVCLDFARDFPVLFQGLVGAVPPPPTAVPTPPGYQEQG